MIWIILETDPQEKANVAEGNPEVTARYLGISEDMASSMREQYRSVERKREGRPFRPTDKTGGLHRVSGRCNIMQPVIHN